MTEQPKQTRRIFTSREISQISRLYETLSAYPDSTQEEVVTEIARALPRFVDAPELIARKLQSLGLIETQVRRYALDEDEKDSVERLVDYVYDKLDLKSGTPRERGVNVALRRALKARVKSRTPDAADETDENEA